MINNLLHKFFSRAILILEKGKTVLKTSKDINESKKRVTNTDIVKSDDFFIKSHKGRQIYSPSINCLRSQYKPILKREIYGFKTSSESPLILDCGSNIGLGIIYWKEQFPKARIIAFEPSKKVFEALERNVQEFELDNVTCINAALSDTDGFQEFTYNEDLSGSLFLEKNLGSTYQVQTIKLESYLQEPIDFLKLDIEGEEINIFPQILKNIANIKNIFLEYHSFIQHPQKLSFFLKGLEENGFRYYIEGEYKHNGPLLFDHVNLEQDLQVSIWATRII